MNQTYNPATDIPSLGGKVIIVTGGTAGLGLQTVENLAAHSPAHIFFTGRSEEKATAIVERLQQKHPEVAISFIKCDMTSLKSVQAAANQFLQTSPHRLDTLIGNAGTMCIDPSVTEDGFQTEWQTNHLGHALLIKLLLPVLQETSAGGTNDVRIVNLTSQAYRQTPPSGIEFATLKTPQARLGNAIVPGHRWARYGQSKLANMLYADALARQYPELTAVSVHPGYIFTSLFDGVSLLTRLPVYLISRGQTLTEEQGAHTQLWAATAPKDKVKTGTYYEPTGVAAKRTTKHARDESLSQKLWDWTQDALKDFS